MMISVSLWWPKAQEMGGPEEAFAVCFCLEHSYQALIRWEASAQRVFYAPEDRLADVLERTFTEYVLWVTDPALLLNPFGLERLMSHAAPTSLYAPAYLRSDEPWQRADPPYPYQDMATYEEVAHSLASSPQKGLLSVPRLDSRCFLIHTSRIRHAFAEPSAISAGDAALFLARQGGFVEPRAFFHSFLPLDEHFREDLAALAPETAFRILDVGCSWGLYGMTVKKARPFVFLAGVELDPRKAQAARQVYDEVYEGAFEAVEIPNRYDLINCGDVLEHLWDPWGALVKMHALLVPAGALVLSVPNMGHWTVVRGLLQGSLDYLPAGVLNRSHVRWFTETSLRAALAHAGFVVEDFQRRQPAPTPQGRLFMKSLRALGSFQVCEQSLLTEAFLVRARKSSMGERK